MILEAKNINYQTIQGKSLLKDVHLSVSPYQSVGIIGANGCGKTTLIKCLSRLNQSFSGSIKILDKELSEYKQQELAQKVAVMHQTNYFPFDFTVEEMIEMGRYPYKGDRYFLSKEDKKIIYQMIADLGLSDKKENFYSSLSGGEKQRVLLARALAQTPNLLILDEPTNHLDTYQQRLILELIAHLNLTTISVLHDLNLAYEFCEVIYMMKQGEVAYFGNTHDVMTPEHIMDVFGVEAEIIKSSNSGKKHLIIS